MIDENKLRELGFRGVAIIRRDGRLENAVLPDHLDREMFSLMTAIMFSSSETINDEINSKMNYVRIDGDEWDLVIMKKDNYNFYAILAKHNMPADEIKEKLRKINNDLNS
jgi:predicted regulator of Ras-like GTPase activity (Roadblock/LC7/MglB family)